MKFENVKSNGWWNRTLIESLKRILLPHFAILSVITSNNFLEVLALANISEDHKKFSGSLISSWFSIYGSTYLDTTGW